MNGSSTGAGGPCGACKFLRRRCVAECVFAPYFNSEEGATQFAAVHKVFGASNASKLLLTIPASQRKDAAFTLSYEALARLHDPVYGCVGHIFALENQVMNLQAELAILQTHLSTLQRLPPPNPQNNSSTEAADSSSNAQLLHSLDNENNVSSSLSQQQQQIQEDIEVSTESVDFSTMLSLEDPVDELVREFFSKYLTGCNFRPSSSIS